MYNMTPLQVLPPHVCNAIEEAVMSLVNRLNLEMSAWKHDLPVWSIRSTDETAGVVRRIHICGYKTRQDDFIGMVPTAHYLITENRPAGISAVGEAQSLPVSEAHNATKISEVLESTWEKALLLEEPHLTKRLP